MTSRVLACAVALLASFEAAAQVVTVPALPKKGYIGMSYGVAGGLIPETDSTAARAVTYPVVSGVEECSPIALAGVKVGDVLTAVNGRDARILPLFGKHGTASGRVHVLTVQRGEESLQVTLTVAEPLAEGEKPSDRCGNAE